LPLRPLGRVGRRGREVVAVAAACVSVRDYGHRKPEEGEGAAGPHASPARRAAARLRTAPAKSKPRCREAPPRLFIHTGTSY
jgi:hypothetical protein